MDKQNSKGYSNSRLHPFAILQHGIEIKKDIQDEILGLIAILKKREHDLCLEVDQQCLELLCEAEELGMCSAQVLNYPNHEVDNGIQYIKKQDLLTSKLKFTGDLNFSQQVLKNYGNLQKIVCRKNTLCKPKTNDQLPERLNEWIKTVRENLEEKKHINMLEKASCCSTDSFEALSEKKIKEQNYCQMMNDLPGNKAQLAACPLPEIVLRAQLNKRPTCVSSARQRSNSRMLNINEWLADAETTTDECCDMLSEISITPASSKSHPSNPAVVAGGDNPLNIIMASVDAYWKQKNWKLWLSPNHPSNEIDSTLYEDWVPKDLYQSLSTSTSSESYLCNPTEVPGGDNPQNTIKACFGAYLKQNDLRLWLSPNHSPNEIDSTLCEQWVAKNASQNLSTEDDIEEPCVFNITQDMIDSFCLIKPKNR